MTKNRLWAACAAFAALTACSGRPGRSLAEELCRGGPLVAADFGDRPDAADLARKANEDCAARKMTRLEWALTAWLVCGSLALAFAVWRLRNRPGLCDYEKRLRHRRNKWCVGWRFEADGPKAPEGPQAVKSEPP